MGGRKIGLHRVHAYLQNGELVGELVIVCAGLEGPLGAQPNTRPVTPNAMATTPMIIVVCHQRAVASRSERAASRLAISARISFKVEFTLACMTSKSFLKSSIRF